MSYKDNGDGTITDNVTGLMWQKGENPSSYNWYQASGTYDATYNPSTQNVCGSLTLGGHSDWRLPTEKELMSIVNYNIPSPGPTINTTYFPDASSGFYWSSTTYANSTGSAWVVHFGNGIVYDAYSKSSGHSVRCVRGGQSSASFTNNGDGTVTDNGTGLMWQQGEPGSKTWADALTYCEGLSLGGQSDWRLPNIKELESITDYFPNTYANYYWSSTTFALSTNYAWCVDFFNGNVSYGKSYYVDKAYGYYVRCVRAGVLSCSGGAVNLQSVTFLSGQTYNCVAITSITAGTGVTVQSGSNVTFQAPIINLQPGFTVESGAVFNMRQ